MIATFAMVRKLIVFAPSLRYCRIHGQSAYGEKLSSVGYRHDVVFQVTRRAEAGECILTGVVAQHGGAFLPRRHAEPVAAGRVSQSGRTHPGLVRACHLVRVELPRPTCFDASTVGFGRIKLRLMWSRNRHQERLESQGATGVEPPAGLKPFPKGGTVSRNR
jgi:hypothetical protein